jgi:hypothetical protein
MASLLTYSTMLLLLTTDDDVLPTNLSNATFNLNAIKKEEKPIIIGRNVQKIQKLPSQPRKTDRLSARRSLPPVLTIALASLKTRHALCQAVILNSLSHVLHFIRPLRPFRGSLPRVLPTDAINKKRKQRHRHLRSTI